MNLYLNNEKPPVCLHILGQGLINAVWAEGKELQKLLHHALGDAAALRQQLDEMIAERDTLQEELAIMKRTEEQDRQERDLIT